MNSGNKFLDQLFNNLSSVYKSDNGMLESNLFILFNAYASEFQGISDLNDDTHNDTYLRLANTNVLEKNFGPFVDFPKPPRLNTVTNGGEIYRAILRSLYDAFLNGSTEQSMDVGLSTVLSFLTIDERTDTTVAESNNVFFNTFDRSIQLAYGATSSSGTTAQPSDITIFPSGLVVTSYDDNSHTINFSGTIPISGQAYIIEYFRDHTSQINTNWVNFTNQNVLSPLPTDLKTFEDTFQNPKFSFWWNTFNRDGNGVQIIDGALDVSEQGLVWRLPEKFIKFTCPFDGEAKKATIELYNFSGQVYDINSDNKSINPDYKQSCTINSYVDEVSRNPNDYYIRYSQNNSIFVALDPFVGNVKQREKVSDLSVDFVSDNFGTLDFFEKGPNFDINDAFGFGTKGVWLNVENKNGIYSLSDTYLFTRAFSLHEDILFSEIFENGQRSLDRFGVISGTAILAEAVGIPLSQPSEDCLQLVGDSAVVYPIIASGVVVSGNRVEIDLFDALNSGTQTAIQINLINSLNQTSSGNTTFKFGIDEDVFGTPFIIGASGNQIPNTKPYGFIDTYFSSTDDTDYSILKSGNYKLVAGNPNPQSNFSLTASGSSVVIFPNLSGASLINTDHVLVQFTNNNGPTFRLGQNTRIGNVFSTRNIIATIGSPFFQWQNTNLFLSGNTVTGVSVGGGLTTIPKISGVNTIELTKGQNIKINGVPYAGAGNIIYDPNNLHAGPPSGTLGFAQSISVVAGSGLPIHHFTVANEFTKQKYGQSSNLPYFYQLAPSGQDINLTSKVYLGGVPRELGWHRLVLDLGSGINHITSSIDNFKFLDTQLGYSGSFGFAGDLNDSKAITLNHTTIFPDREFSYFDNVNLTYFTPTQTRPRYNYQEDITQDWQGSFLDQSAVLSNRVFKGSRQANFTFELIIKGLENKFLFIISSLVDKLKPAHTLVDLEVQTDNTLNTTSLVAEFVDDPRNWETGNLLSNVIVTPEVDAEDALDLPGIITISGS